MANSDDLSFNFSIPCVDGGHSIHLAAGKTLFVLGPNGAGKSSLLQHFASQADFHLVKWIRAHRRSWMDSNVPDMSPAAFRRQQSEDVNYMRRPDARYLVHNDGFDAQSSIASLIRRKNADARRVNDMVREDRYRDARKLAQRGDVLHTLNSVLEQSSIPIVVSIGDEDDVLATKNGSTYGVNEMSDGERSVLLLAASVLTTNGGTCFLLDEPERHLHRAIIAPLLSTLFRSRDDCSFVISTHEVQLPLNNPTAEVMLVRGCYFENGMPARWDFDFIGADQNIPEVIKKSILGARRKIVFVEGEESSLDYRLYARIFQDASVVPAGSRASVISAVRSIRLSSSYHGISAFGLVDEDHVEKEDVEQLEQRGVFVVDGYAVESIYYDSNVQRMVVRRHTDDEGVERRLEDAAERVLTTFQRTETAERMCESRAEAMRRRKVLVEIDRLGLDESTLELHGMAILQREKKRLENIVEARGVDKLIRGYPIKKSSILTEIAKALGFRDRETYEDAVLRLLEDNCDALAYVRKRFKDLLVAMDEAHQTPNASGSSRS